VTSQVFARLHDRQGAQCNPRAITAGDFARIYESLLV